MYTWQRNFVKKQLRNTKRIYFNSLDIRKVTYNRTFWKTVFPLFSNKFLRNEKINLTKENEIILTDSEVSRVFSNFHSKAIQKQSKNLKFQVFQILCNENNDSLKQALSYFENHPCIINVK